MTLSDDEVLARVRTALHSVADRTPISAGRIDDVWTTPYEKRPRPTVTIVSAAAAVAAIAAVAAVAANTRSSDSPRVLPAAAGALPVVSSANDCVPENYGVIASAAEVEGLTYLLPATPVGYHLYGAWGTISRNHCPSSVTWYVEYDATTFGPGSATSIQLEVVRQDGTGPAAAPLRAESVIAPTSATASRPASAPTPSVSSSGSAPATASASAAAPSPGASLVVPPARTSVMVGGHPGTFLPLGDDGVVAWAAAGDLFQITGPIVDGKPDALVALAGALIVVPTDDPRIVAPANCQVPAGQVCPD